jgi:hypothetical protein
VKAFNDEALNYILFPFDRKERCSMTIYMRFLLFLPLLFLFACGNSPAPEGSLPAYSLPPELRDARLAFQRKGQIVVSSPLSKGKETEVTTGTWPRWSPDGTWVAFLDGNRVSRILIESGEVEVLSEVRNPRTLAVPKLGNEVIFTDGNLVKSVNVDTGGVRILEEGRALLEIDVVGDVILGTQKVLGGFRVNSSSGKEEKNYGKGCSASFSPDGTRVTRNEGDHTRLAVLDAESGEQVLMLPAPPGRKTDNQFWSNHPDWVVSMDEDSGHIYAHRISDLSVFRISKSGNGDRPDLWVP